MHSPPRSILAIDRGGCEELNLRTVLSPVRTEGPSPEVLNTVPLHRLFACSGGRATSLRSGGKSAPTGR